MSKDETASALSKCLCNMNTKSPMQCKECFHMKDCGLCEHEDTVTNFSQDTTREAETLSEAECDGKKLKYAGKPHLTEEMIAYAENKLKTDGRKEGWGNFTISPQDCGIDYVPETKSVDHIISLLGSTAKDKLMPDAYRETAKQFLPVFRDFKSQLIAIQAQNAELVLKVKIAREALEHQAMLFEGSRESRELAKQALASLRSPSSK